MDFSFCFCYNCFTVTSVYILVLFNYTDNGELYGY